MDDNLTSVNAEQVSGESSQVEQVETTAEAVNADNSEVTTTEPVQTKEENANFAEQRRAREAAEAKAATIERDYSIAKQYGAEWGVYSEADIAEKYGVNGITNLSQFEAAVREHEMKEKGVDPNAVKQYVDNDPDVKAAREWKRQQEEYGEFFKAYPDVKGNEIPVEVWQEYQKGKNLLDAYVRHENNQLKAKLKAIETNQANADSSTGSITGNGTGKNITLTPEAIEAMTDKERMARWPEIKKVLGMK